MRRAVKAVFTTLALALALVPVVGTGPALAAHGLDVEPEITESLVGGSHILTATTDVAPAGGIEVDFEIDGPNDPEKDGNTPVTPRSCTVPAGATTCQVSYPGTLLGVDTIRAFIDLDKNNVNNESEVDMTEGQDAATAPGGQAEPDNTDVVTLRWVNAPAHARNVVLTPKAATNAPGTVHAVTATVRDRFGNPVQGVGVAFTETGVGNFTNRTAAVTATTGAAGTATAETTTLASETGDQTITATIDATATDCELVANDPAGAPAGNCADTVTKRWEVAAAPGGGGGPGASGEQGYTMVAADGGIFNFGTSRFFGSTGALKLNQPVVGMDHTPNTKGYWLVAADGGIFAFGDAKFFGSTGAIRLNRPIVGMRSTPTGNGYWLVASDGGIFAFGDARFLGSTGALRLNQPIVGMDRSPTGNGYWLVASDGGIFAFGDATFFGSTGATRLNQPVVGMSRTNSGQGYHLVAADGGIFAFGDAVFRGSTGAIRLNSPIDDIAPTSTGGGYWLCARDGGVFAFGNARFLGSMGATRLNQPVVGCDAPLAQGGVAT